MADAQVVGAVAIEHVSDTTTRTLNMANLVDVNTGGAFDCIDGDLLVVFVGYSGGSTTIPATPTGLTRPAWSDSVTSGATAYCFYKQNLSAADNTATYTIVTSVANRTNVIGLIIRGAPKSGDWWSDTPLKKNTSPATGNSSTSSVQTPSKYGIMRLEYCVYSATGFTPTEYPLPAGATLTRARTGSASTQLGAKSTTGVTGVSTSAVGYSNTPVLSGTIGGTTWTNSSEQTTNGNSVIWTISVLPDVAASSVVPSATVSQGTYTLVGGATAHEVTADPSSANYIVSVDAPASAAFEVTIPDLLAKDIVEVDYGFDTEGTGSISYLVTLKQSGSTVCTKTVVVADTAGEVVGTMSSTTTQATAMTQTSGVWKNLSIAVAETAV